MKHWMLPLFFCASAALSAQFPTAAVDLSSPEKIADVADAPGLPRVLLIGDSISIGYTIAVREALAGKANVHRIPANGAATGDGLAHLESWLGNKRWDVIHFNWGLHDIKLTSEGGTNVPLEEYEKNLRTLVNRLQASSATLIWATTTPVPAVPETKLSPRRRNQDVVRYNAAARKIMEEDGIAIDDLYSLALPKLAEVQLPANVHYTAEGCNALGKEVAACILRLLAGRLSPATVR